MLEILSFEFFDQQIKVYDNVGIINGRIKAFSEGTYVGEVFYTAIFVKQTTSGSMKTGKELGQRIHRHHHLSLRRMKRNN